MAEDTQDGAGVGVDEHADERIGHPATGKEPLIQEPAPAAADALREVFFLTRNRAGSNPREQRVGVVIS